MLIILKIFVIYFLIAPLFFTGSSIMFSSMPRRTNISLLFLYCNLGLSIFLYVVEYIFLSHWTFSELPQRSWLCPVFLPCLRNTIFDNLGFNKLLACEARLWSSRLAYSGFKSVCFSNKNGSSHFLWKRVNWATQTGYLIFICQSCGCSASLIYIMKS